MLLPLLLAAVLPQDPAIATAGPTVRVALTAKVPAEGESLRWSPKAATVPLTKSDDKLSGEFALGPKGTPAIRVELRRSPSAEHFAILAVDCDRDGSFADVWQAVEYLLEAGYVTGANIEVAGGYRL